MEKEEKVIPQKKLKPAYLEELGVDVPEFMEEFIGEKQTISGYDIYTGPTVTIRSKNGKIVEDTELTFEEFVKYYGNENELSK